jgi:hypothetical protein
VSYRLIDHEPEGRTDKVRAMRGHSVAEARLPLLAFELGANLRAARKLNVSIPASILSRATRVVE